jgi:hypothetical protein
MAGSTQPTVGAAGDSCFALDGVITSCVYATRVTLHETFAVLDRDASERSPERLEMTARFLREAESYETTTHATTLAATDPRLLEDMRMVEKLERRQAPQTIAWFSDLYKRKLLDLEPPYQRRAVWNQKFRDFFVETVLLHYPAPPIFLHEDIRSDGSARYAVVDGKQRLSTVFDFADDLFPVAEESLLQRLQGKFFSQLEDDTKKTFWTYQFPVEFVPTTDESTLTSIFDRFNRNVARLTRQELRHAKFDGEFAKAVEELAEYLFEEMPADVPHIAKPSLRQMKDVEFVAQLVLLLENGPQSFSQDDLDDAYSERDEFWSERKRVERTYRRVVSVLRVLFGEPELSQPPSRRLRNQADFYALFGTVSALLERDELPKTNRVAQRLGDFMKVVTDEAKREENDRAKRYFQAARSASNDLRQRLARIEILTEVVLSSTSI